MRNFSSRLMPNLDLTFDREVMERIMDLSPPGIDELMALAAVMDFLTPEGYDLLVLDAAPTGHLIRLLELPEIIEEWLKAFFGLFLKYRKIFRLPGISQRLVRLSKDLKRLRAILRDPSRAALYAVSILTEMSFAETTDLVAACGRLEIPVPCLFLNMATPEGPDPLCAFSVPQGIRCPGKICPGFPRHQPDGGVSAERSPGNRKSRRPGTDSLSVRRQGKTE